MPALVLGASMTGFGSLARENGIDIFVTVVATLGIWGLPGQMVMVEMMAVGAPLFAVALGVGVANARFLPMTLAIAPYLSDWKAGWLRRLAFAQFVTLTPWVAALRWFPEMPVRERMPYYMGYTVVCLASATGGTVLGHVLAGELPAPLVMSLVFLSPAFFFMVFVDVRHRHGVIALVLGAGVGPMLHTWSPEWGLPLTGLIAGTAAFGIDAWLRRKEAST